jgi:hypothetical protein
MTDEQGLPLHGSKWANVIEDDPYTGKGPYVAERQRVSETSVWDVKISFTYYGPRIENSREPKNPWWVECGITDYKVCRYANVDPGSPHDISKSWIPFKEQDV